MIQKNMIKNLRYYFMFLIIGLTVYGNSLHNPFMMDDDYLIIQDSKMHQIKYWFYQFIPDLNKYLNLEDRDVSAYFRPIAHILPMIGYFLFKEDVFGYHVMNLLLLILGVWMVFAFLNRLIKDERKSFFVSILFLVHPINGLLVNYITASVFSAQVICIILSIWCLLEGSEKYQMIRSFASCVFAVLALLCHETSFMLTGYVLLILVYSKRKTWKEAFRIALPVFVISLIFLVFRIFFASLRSNILNKAGQLQMNAAEYLAAFTQLIAWYVSKIFILKGIVLIWIVEKTPEQVFIYILLLAAAVFGVVYLFRLRNKFPSLVLGILIFMLGLLPVLFACVFQPSHGLMMEPHWLVFPSIGLFLFLVELVYLMERKIIPRAGFILLICFIIVSAGFSFKYNELWGNEREYCRYWIRQVPGYKMAYFYLANAYMKHGEDQLARENFFKAVEGKTIDWQVFNNLAQIEEKIGQHEKAKEYYVKALKLSPRAIILNNNYGVFLYKNGEINSAETYFKNAIEYNRFFLEPRLNLARIYLQKNNYKEAEKLYQDNLGIIPDHHETLFEMMNMYLMLGQKNNIEKLGEKILRISDPGPDLLTELGEVSAVHNVFSLAEVFFLQAIKNYPKDVSSYRELGKLYANASQMDKALKVWTEGLKILPEDVELKSLINQNSR